MLLDDFNFESSPRFTASTDLQTCPFSSFISTFLLLSCFTDRNFDLILFVIAVSFFSGSPKVSLIGSVAGFVSIGLDFVDFESTFLGFFLLSLLDECVCNTFHLPSNFFKRNVWCPVLSNS